MTADRAELADIVSRFQAGGASAEITLMALLLASGDLAVTSEAVAATPELARLLRANIDGCETIVRMLEEHEPEPAAPADETIDRVRRMFDRSVAVSEESSVALYSLGNPVILDAATREVVDEIERNCTLDRTTRVVELGCGIGRFLSRLASRVASVHGVDVSPAMVEVARRRCARFANVTVSLASGRDLAPIGDGAADLVLAIDVLPYVVQGGAALVDGIFADIARVLAPGGILMAFNFSYRQDLDLDRADFARLATRHGLALRTVGEARLGLWNGVLFSLGRAHSRPTVSDTADAR